MRTISGRRNRTVLVLGGLLLLIAAAWVASAATPLLERWPAGDPFLPHGDSLPADIATAHAPWILPVALVVSILVAILGILLLIAQIPTAPSSGTMRITGEDDQLLGSIPASVIERALNDTVENTPGVTDASVHLGGSAEETWIQASITVAEDAETGWVAELVRQQLIDHTTTVLGTAPRRVDLLVRLRSARSPKGAQVGSACVDTPAADPAAA